MAWKGAKPPRVCGAEGDRALEGLCQNQWIVLGSLFVKEKTASKKRKKIPAKTFIQAGPSYAVRAFNTLAGKLKLQRSVAGTCNNVVLLFLCKVDEAYCIARNANREVCIFGLFRMSLAVLELFYAEYVYVQVVCTLCKVSVHDVNKVVNLLAF